MTQVADTPIVRTLNPAKPKRTWLWIVAAVVVVLVAAFGWMLYRMSYVPDDLNLSTTLATQQGLFEVTYVAENNPVPINQIQQWTIHVENSKGQLVENAMITVDGDMPQHGHGLPTRPQVTRYLGNGDYLVDGLKFHMPGWWVVDFFIDANGQQDQVRFNLLLE